MKHYIDNPYSRRLLYLETAQQFALPITKRKMQIRFACDMMAVLLNFSDYSHLDKKTVPEFYLFKPATWENLDVPVGWWHREDYGTRIIALLFSAEIALNP